MAEPFRHDLKPSEFFGIFRHLVLSQIPHAGTVRCHGCHHECQCCHHTHGFAAQSVHPVSFLHF
jgi:hypothetical protein